jgi:pantoate--beta-alanine ligase
MKVIDSPSAMTRWSRETRQQGCDIALVPTMGYFHEGHLALMDRAGQLADRVAVSLFVNPKQFGPAEDFERYPQDFERDAALAESRKVDVLFAPSEEQMYREDCSTSIHVAGLTERLCGASRSGHFDGVATVVAKLFNIIHPQYAVFGEKDFQQLAVIRRMVRDLDIPLEVISHPTVREKDGLAMSSRNTYLTASDRKRACCLYESILLARRLVSEGVSEAQRIKEAVKQLLGNIPAVELDYAEVVNGSDLSNTFFIDNDSVLLLAVRIGSTRLIDNGRIMQ